MKKNVYFTPVAEFLCISTDTDILNLSFGTEIPYGVGDDGNDGNVI